MSTPVGDVFRALADPSRRELRGAPGARDGQTLLELTRRPAAHDSLRADEAPPSARRGRSGHEPQGGSRAAPLPESCAHPPAARPLDPQYEPWAEALASLKTTLEGGAETMPMPPRHVYEVYIRTTPEQLWCAITSPEYTRRYFYGGVYEATWQAGTPYRTCLQDGSVPFEGELLEVEPPRRLVYTFHYVGDDDTRPEQPSRVTWEITPAGEMCRLTVVHDGFAPGELKTYARVGGGWPYILSSLKSVLETGTPLPPPA